MATNSEALAAANPPVAPTPEIPSTFDGLRVKLHPAAQAAESFLDLAMGGGITPASKILPVANNVVEQTYQGLKDTVTDPEKRLDFMVGLASGGDEETPFDGLRVRKVNTAEALAEQAGLKYKGELVKDSDVHMFEHPDHPGKTMAAPGKELTTPEALKDRMQSKLDEFAPKTKTNASGESSASMEAINRVASEKLGKSQRIKIDTRSGKETPLHGVDAVDVKPGDHDVIVQRTPKGETLLDKGSKARYNKK